MNLSGTNSNAHLTSGRLLARNTIWNLIGGGAPMLVAIVTVRSERLLMEPLNYNLLFRWFVGMDMDEAVW